MIAPEAQFGNVSEHSYHRQVKCGVGGAQSPGQGSEEDLRRRLVMVEPPGGRK